MERLGSVGLANDLLAPGGMTGDGALAGSIALVTGASGGIAARSRPALAAEGAQVQALARRPPAGARTIAGTPSTSRTRRP